MFVVMLLCFLEFIVVGDFVELGERWFWELFEGFVVEVDEIEGWLEFVCLFVVV